jgi:hypothetical protein
MRLPTESELCDEFNASRFTIREALRRMLEQGMVQRRQGAGSVVVSTRPQARYVHTLSSLSDLFQFALVTTCCRSTKSRWMRRLQPTSARWPASGGIWWKGCGAEKVASLSAIAFVHSAARQGLRERAQALRRAILRTFGQSDPRRNSRKSGRASSARR